MFKNLSASQEFCCNISSQRISLILLLVFSACYNFHNSIIISKTENSYNHDFDSSSSGVLEEQIKKVLKSEAAFAAKDFSDDTYDNPLLFPNVGIMQGRGIVACSVLPPNLVNNSSANNEEWDILMRNIPINPRQGEFLQEVGFIEMLRAYYPKSFTIVSDLDTASALGLEIEKNISSRVGAAVLVEDLTNISPIPRVFLPLCGKFVSHGTMGQSPLEYATNAIILLQKKLSSKKIFYVSPHPGTRGESWDRHLINNARALKIDQSNRGFFNDIIIPISLMPSICDDSSNKLQIRKQNLIYSCGKDHSRVYKGLRTEIPKIFNSLENRTGIDMSTKRSKKAYDLGFYKSKFCLIIPGDTTGTSQCSRAMFAGCVPIFIAMDFRDLPFSNILDYSSFSVRIHSNYLFTNNTLFDYDRASDFCNMLEEMVVNGTYDKLRRNVAIVRDFFNYHRFGSRSPYGAALVSMYQDEINELKR